MSSTVTLSPRQILMDIRQSPDFREHRTSSELGHAFSTAAQVLAELETSPSGLRTVEGHAFALVGQINDFAESVDELKRPGLTKLREDYHKRRIISFNHELSIPTKTSRPIRYASFSSMPTMPLIVPTS